MNKYAEAAEWLDDEAGEFRMQAGKAESQDMIDYWTKLAPMAELASKVLRHLADGAVLVPSEPTPEMRIAGNHADFSAATHLPAEFIWRAMLAASPLREQT